ncbi:hypothetical protein Hanom_Chr08g00752071 [Helianthus anomalus]
MRGLNCIKRLQCNLIRHLILSQSLLTRQLRSWTETALSFNAGSFCARARPCAARPLGSLPCAHAPHHHARCATTPCGLLAQVRARCGLLAQVRARCATSPVSLYERATQSRHIGSLWCVVHDTA